MKSFLTSFPGVACLVLLIAFVGILSQGGQANLISYLSVAPAACFGGYMLFQAFRAK